MDHNVGHQSYYCGMVNVLAIDWTQRDPNRQINDTKEYNTGEQMECQTHCCYEQAEEGITQGRTGSRAQDGEHPGYCIQGDERDKRRWSLE